MLVVSSFFGLAPSAIRRLQVYHTHLIGGEGSRDPVDSNSHGFCCFVNQHDLGSRSQCFYALWCRNRCVVKPCTWRKVVLEIFSGKIPGMRLASSSCSRSP